MKKITQQEFDSAPIKTKNNLNPAFAAIIKLQKGEMMQIDKDDYPNKTDFQSAIANTGVLKGMKFETHSLVDNAGWIVKRLK